MVTNGGNPEGLFRAAFLESGAPIPIGDITHGQGYYDFIVEQTNCTSSSDTLQCLREVPYTTLMNAINQTPNIMSYQVSKPMESALDTDPYCRAWQLPGCPEWMVYSLRLIHNSLSCKARLRIFRLSQGIVMTKELSFHFLHSILRQSIICIILASLIFSPLFSTDTQLSQYLQTYWFPTAPASAIQQLLVYYPQDPTQGSPYNTGILNQLSPQYKRIASIQGDAAWQAPRRFFLQQRSSMQKTWAFRE